MRSHRSTPVPQQTSKGIETNQYRHRRVDLNRFTCISNKNTENKNCPEQWGKKKVIQSKIVNYAKRLIC